jgi:hypothetical protein
MLEGAEISNTSRYSFDRNRLLTAKSFHETGSSVVLK